MQDINPIRKTLAIKEDTLPDDTDVRASIGVGETDTTPQILEDDLQNKRAHVSFSSLYTPESRRNVTDMRPRSPDELPKKNLYIRPRKKVTATKIVAYTSALLMLLGVLMYTFVFSSATIEITPVRKVVDVNQGVVLTENELASPEVVQIVIASSTKSATIKPRTSQQVVTKASGTITIFNNFDEKPQKLITNTRFETKDGKVYRIAESILVPGKTATAPGSIDVVVYADSTGESYNVAKADLTVPGFKGTPRYALFNAKTKTSLSGGFSGTRATIAKEDITAASDSLLPDLKKDIANKIQSSTVSSDYILLDKNIVYSEADNQQELLLDPARSYLKTLSVKTVYVKKSYLVQKIQETSRLEASDALIIESTDTINFLNSTSTQNSTNLAFTMQGSLALISNLDEIAIAEALAGTRKKEFASKMSVFPGIAEAKPILRPFWILRFPNDIKHIKIKVVK